MAEEVTGEGQGTDPAPAEERLRRRAPQVELAVFLFLIVPSLLLSFVAGSAGGPQVGFRLLAASVIARDLSLVALVVFFVWRDGEPLRRLGWVLDRKAGRDVVLGVLLFLPLQTGAAALEAALQRFGLSVPAHPPSSLLPTGGSQRALAVVLVLVVAIAEETIFRGYLLLRLRSWTRSTVAIVLVSSFVFALGHGYEGSAGVVTVGALGVVFALVYLWRGSLVAPITLHFLVDFVGIVIAPSLGRR